jgi:hypothetical protein
MQGWEKDTSLLPAVKYFVTQSNCVVISEKLLLRASAGPDAGGEAFDGVKAELFVKQYGGAVVGGDR